MKPPNKLATAIILQRIGHHRFTAIALPTSDDLAAGMAQGFGADDVEATVATLLHATTITEGGAVVPDNKTRLAGARLFMGYLGIRPRTKGKNVRKKRARIAMADWDKWEELTEDERDRLLRGTIELIATSDLCYQLFKAAP